MLAYYVKSTRLSNYEQLASVGSYIRCARQSRMACQDGGSSENREMPRLTLEGFGSSGPGRTGGSASRFPAFASPKLGACQPLNVFLVRG